MLNFLKSPFLKNADSYELARFKLTWDVNIFLSISLLILTIISLFEQSDYIIYYLTGFAMSMIALWYMRYRRLYKNVAISLAVLMYFMIIQSMYSLNGYVHYMEPFWALVITLYLYFVRGKVLGTIVLVATIVFTSFFFVFRLNATVELVSEMSTYRLVSMAVEFTICLIMIGYLLNQFINSSVIAEKELKRSNFALQREKKLVEKQNCEKTILLQEIHHRVKNNLQIITSLLRMQAEKIDSEETKTHFQDAVNRILTMSLIHQKLYENENLSAINLSEYVQSLCKDLLRINDNSQRIEQFLSIDCQQIGAKTLVPMGLIITELISNSVKHAFDTIENPQIYIEIKISKNRKNVRIKYSDNGVWKEPRRESFGIQLIDTFTEQLEGQYNRIIKPEGTVYHFDLKNLDKNIL